MYGLCLYSLSPIQKGIQFGHAIVEYVQQHFNDEEYQSFANNDKTFILLDGGSSNYLSEMHDDFLDSPRGSLNSYCDEIKSQGIKVGEFYEPDINNALTAICFLVDERVFDREKYPDFQGSYISQGFTTRPMEPEYSNWLKQFSDDRNESLKIVWFRSLLRQFHLAR